MLQPKVPIKIYHKVIYTCLLQSNIHHKCRIFYYTDSEARRAQDVYLDVNTSNNAQQSSEDESSTYEDVEGSHPNEESSHFETDEGSHSTIDSPSSDEEQTGEGETIRICIVDPLETQSETGKQILSHKHRSLVIVLEF